MSSDSAAPEHLEILHVLPVGVPDPLGDVRKPRLHAEVLETADEILVAEGREPAEDLADDADEHRLLSEIDRHRAKEVAPGGERAGELRDLPRTHGHRRIGQRVAEDREGPVAGAVGGPALRLVRAVDVEHLAERVAPDEPPPAEPHERPRVFAEPRVAVGARGLHDEHVVVPGLVHDLSQERGVLSEPARPPRRRHEEGDLRRVEARLFRDLEKIADRHALGKTLVPRRETSRELVRPRVAGRRRMRVYSEITECGREGAASLVRHSRDVEGAPAEPSPPFFHHLSTPLLSRYASQRVIMPASLLCPSNCSVR